MKNSGEKFGRKNFGTNKNLEQKIDAKNIDANFKSGDLIRGLRVVSQRASSHTDGGGSEGEDEAEGLGSVPHHWCEK